ncbi:GIY-YIG nuclease family protein [Bacillus cereus]|uniref:GIY-YIG nuclease family protein n=1 Tax=Bacillus cereus TaxID=1396 RepID=UPI001C3F3D08
MNKLTDMQQVSITPGYLKLKIEELYLKYSFEQMKQEEKEEQLEIKERMREEAKALKELEKAKEKVEKEEKHFEQAIEKLKMQMTETTENQQAKLIEKLKELEAQLEQTRKDKEDVLYRVQNTRAGYVYIISNIGSFGENVFKIGMTRRLEPMDRVKELGDASVPFTFDVHGMIFSEDAPALENALHQAFADKRVNKVNARKEFFRVELAEIENVVKKNHNKTVEFTKLAEAEDFRKSIQLEKMPLQAV